MMRELCLIIPLLAFVVVGGGGSGGGGGGGVDGHACSIT